MFRTGQLVVLLAMLLVIPPVMAQTALIRPNENLVAEGIPEIPAALAEKVQRYTESRSASLGVHPGSLARAVFLCSAGTLVATSFLSCIGGLWSLVRRCC